MALDRRSSETSNVEVQSAPCKVLELNLNVSTDRQHN